MLCNFAMGIEDLILWGVWILKPGRRRKKTITISFRIHWWTIHDVELIRELEKYLGIANVPTDRAGIRSKFFKNKCAHSETQRLRGT